MTYIYDNISGRVASVVLQGAPSIPVGFTATGNPILVTDPLTKKVNIGTGLLVAMDLLVIVGNPFVGVGTVGQIAVQKIDGTTLAPKTSSGDNDPVSYDLENSAAFLNKDTGNLVSGADAVKVAAPQSQAQSRLLVFSPSLQLLDTDIIFS